MDACTLDPDALAPARAWQGTVPCVVCGCPERWDDQGIWRCLVCWPSTRTGAANGRGSDGA
jgi:hypothetical protein